MRVVRAVVFALASAVLVATPARADITAFLGATTTPVNRPVVGGALGISLLAVGFELEVAQAKEDTVAKAPSLTTGMGNIFLQNPIPVAGIQFYGTAGGGLYRQELGSASETSFAVNMGGGAKIELVSHVRLRIDYRVFKLSGTPLSDAPKRVYVGLSLAL